MTDPDLVRRKTERVLHHVTRLRERTDLDAARLIGDEDLCNSVLMDLQQAIQGCIDLAAHACAEEALGAPSGPAEAFEILARSGRIDAALGVRLAGAAGLRNVIVHQYTQIDVELILEVIRADLGDLERFVLALRS